MKKIFFLVILLFTISVQVYSEGIINAPIKSIGVGDEFGRMQFGWLGISARGIYSIPVGEMINVLNNGLGGELVISYRSFLLKDLDIQLIGGYENYTGEVNSSDTLQTIILKLLVRYNFYFKGTPGCLFVDLGGGVAFETLTFSSTKYDNIDPAYHIGIGYEVEIIKSLTFQLGVSYLFIPQKYIANAQRDGSFINVGLGINYEFLKEKFGGE
jgi:hypothetical protein